MSKKVFIITGEYSGNLHGAAVANQLKSQNPDIQIEGIGAEAMEAEGVKLFSNHAKMSAVGLSLKILKEHIELGKRVVDYINNEFQPDVVLLIDYGGFNMKIAKYLKTRGFTGKVFYYIPPQVWVTRKYRIKSIKKYVDKVLCIFPFEEEMYKEYGVDVHFCGHPLISQLPAAKDKKPVSREKEDKKVIDKAPSAPYSDVNDSIPKLMPDEQTVLRAMNGMQRHVDDVIAETGLTTGKILAAITMLELKGIIRRLPGKRIEMK